MAKEAGDPEAAVLGGVSAAVDVLVGLYGDVQVRFLAGIEFLYRAGSIIRVSVDLYD